MCSPHGPREFLGPGPTGATRSSRGRQRRSKPRDERKEEHSRRRGAQQGAEGESAGRVVGAVFLMTISWAVSPHPHRVAHFKYHASPARTHACEVHTHTPTRTQVSLSVSPSAWVHVHHHRPAGTLLLSLQVGQFAFVCVRASRWLGPPGSPFSFSGQSSGFDFLGSLASLMSAF